MVNSAEIFGVDPTAGHAERALALSYAKPALRPPIVALFALDATLAKLARQTREPIVAQMRLAWWRDRLGALARTPVPGQPVLTAVAGVVAEHGLDPADLIPLVDGWEALVADELPAYASGRARLFAVAGALIGATGPWLAEAGEGWALADIATSSPDPPRAAAARAAALPLLDRALAHRSSRAARPLGALALVARMDLDGRVPGDPRRLARLLRYRVIGR